MSKTMAATQAIRTTRAGVTRCHCGADMGRTDHCPCCRCEEWETVCEHVCPRPRTRTEAKHADHNQEGTQ